MKIYVTATNLLSVHEFEFDTKINPDLPYAEFVKATEVEKILDKEYPEWVQYELNIDEKDIVIETKFVNQLPPEDEE